jgi:hypothetical protein
MAQTRWSLSDLVQKQVRRYNSGQKLQVNYSGSDESDLQITTQIFVKTVFYTFRKLINENV